MVDFKLYSATVIEKIKDDCCGHVWDKDKRQGKGSQSSITCALISPVWVYFHFFVFWDLCWVLIWEQDSITKNKKVKNKPNV